MISPQTVSRSPVARSSACEAGPTRGGSNAAAYELVPSSSQRWRLPAVIPAWQRYQIPRGNASAVASETPAARRRSREVQI